MPVDSAPFKFFSYEAIPLFCIPNEITVLTELKNSCATEPALPYDLNSSIVYFFMIPIMTINEPIISGNMPKNTIANFHAITNANTKQPSPLPNSEIKSESLKLMACLMLSMLL